MTFKIKTYKEACDALDTSKRSFTLPVYDHVNDEWLVGEEDVKQEWKDKNLGL